jgi:peptidyl-prolyl cis-trans isomerase A (cyclophilin A)
MSIGDVAARAREALGWAAVVGASMVMSGCAGSDSAAGAAARSDRSSGGGDTAAQLIPVELRTSEGDIRIELDRAHAPITDDNFLKYADAGAYDGTIFHRVVPGFVVQGGGWTADLHERAKDAAAAGHPDVPIKNEWQNGLKNQRGTIAMARDAAPDTATREFYINLVDNPKLDTAREKTGNAGYAVFGRVVHGMEVVDRIGHAPTHPVQVAGVTDGSMENVPAEPIVIYSVHRSK